MTLRLVLLWFGSCSSRPQMRDPAEPLEAPATNAVRGADGAVVPQTIPGSRAVLAVAERRTTAGGHMTRTIDFPPPTTCVNAG